MTEQVVGQIVPLKGHPLEARVNCLPCEAYVMQPTVFAELRSACMQVERMHPHHRALATLDDVAQAFYTNGHAVNMYALDQVEGHDLSLLSAEVFEDGEHRGYFSTAEEFPIRVANFQARSLEQTTAPKRLSWVDSNTELSVAQVNARPDMIIDQPCIIMAVPVQRACETVMAFPNGYFSGDLSPFEVYDLCSRMEAIGYELFAIGASYLAFEARKETGDISEILTGLYIEPDVEALTQAGDRQSFLILRYTE